MVSLLSSVVLILIGILLVIFAVVGADKPYDKFARGFASFGMAVFLFGLGRVLWLAFWSN